MCITNIWFREMGQNKNAFQAIFMLVSITATYVAVAAALSLEGKVAVANSVAVAV